MIGSLLNITILPLSIFINNLLTMGLPVIDQNLEELLGAMAESPLQLNTLVGAARSIGSALALCAGAYECWVMMLGRRGLDVLKILRIVGIAICINLSPTICKLAKAPGAAMEEEMRAHAMAKNNDVANLEISVAKKQSQYIDSIRAAQGRRAKEDFAIRMAQAKKDYSVGEAAEAGMLYLGQKIEDYATQGALIVESKVGEWINDIIRFIGEVLFQMMYYGMLLAQRCFMAILGMFCPIAFALSLAPPFKSAWSQWLSKYLSLSLWGFVVYCVLFYTEFLMTYFLNQDMTAYTELLGIQPDNSSLNTTAITTLGIQSIGTTIAYVVSMFVGCKVLSMVPEVASWLIPGGVSSGAGSAAMGAAGMVVGYAGGAAATAAGAVTGGTSTAAAVYGAYNQSKSDGGGLGSAVMSQTSLGKSYASGAEGARSYNRVGKEDVNYQNGGGKS